MNRQLERYLKGTLIFLDLLALNLSNFSLQGIFANHVNHEFLGAYNRYFLITNGFWLVLSITFALYSIRVISDFNTFVKRTVQVVLVYLMLVMVYLFFSRELLLSRKFVFYSSVSFSIALFFIRFLFLGFQRYFRKSESLKKRVLIVGYNETSKKLTKFLESENSNADVMGYIENPEIIRELTNYPILGDFSSALDIARKMDIHEIFYTGSIGQGSDLNEFIRRAERESIKVKIVPNLDSYLVYDSHIEFYGGVPVLTRRYSALDDAGNVIKKRLLDVVASSLIIILVLSWVIPILGILIIIESGLPIFFKQKRTGMSNKPFWCYKLRSMKVNKDADNKQATKDDMRITRVGKFMRRTSLDEFPQFFNVFLGDMSLVGPRPHMLKHTELYASIVDEFMVRQFVKPGITGWAQINGFRGEINSESDIRNRVELDLWYIEHWTLWLDIQILFLTVYKVIVGDKKAY
ncbi:MAG: undecaprenyl-phosphate glucose phosphotransferase [Chitinophagaceae bacterium]|nr:undecaprenyl-phosphate glucose phosphotransferase [Chitinophagaceae bacterium]MCW5915416.1 undecaprenyl-phosphate glucose phosphotransferase [Chitinophagaceae bacterium]MCZ2397682.1 undecaprenyl-phosphate glucose phosphotransferase [Chitinophagales bacterium]